MVITANIAACSEYTRNNNNHKIKNTENKNYEKCKKLQIEQQTIRLYS